VTEMDRVVQQNASAVLQSASAAEAMKHEAQALVQAVSAFRVDGSALAASPREREAQASREASVSTPSLATTAVPAGVAGARAPAMAGGDDDWQEF